MAARLLNCAADIVRTETGIIISGIEGNPYQGHIRRQCLPAAGVRHLHEKKCNADQGLDIVIINIMGNGLLGHHPGGFFGNDLHQPLL